MKKIFKFLFVLILLLFITSCDSPNETCELLGHEYEAIVTKPTCEKDGFTTYTCKYCKSSYIEDKINAIGHEIIVVEELLPTCENDGHTSGEKCTRCDYNTSVIIPALGHDIVIAEKVDPTCENTGLNKGEHCTRCDYKVAQEVIPALGHDIVIDEKVEPTCENTGLTKGEHCTRCDYKVAQEVISALGHDIIIDEKVEPTCTETGLTEGSHCTRCDYKVAQEVIPALDHDIVIDENVEPTCTETGLTEGSHCTRCDYKVAQEVIPALGHDIVIDKKVDPTCENTGLTKGEHCTRCDHKVAQEVIPALNHDIVIDEKVEPTCENTGLTKGEHCTRCDYKVAQEVIPALGHDIVIDEKVEPTCTETGLTEGSHCTRCDYKVAQEVIPALGHDIVIDEKVDPTCENTGLTSGEHCTRCDYKVAQEVIPSLGHDIVIDEKVEPEYNKPGLTEGKHCSRCYLVIEEQVIIEPNIQQMNISYDDHIDISNYVVEIIEKGNPISHKVGYGVSDELDDQVISIKNNYLVATGIGDAVVKIDDIYYEINVKSAPISLILLIGQSNMRGSEGDPNQSIICPNGMVYSTYGDDRGDKEGILNINSARKFVPSALSGEYSLINVEGTTEHLGYYPVNSLTREGKGKFGPDSGFAYEWVKQTNEKIWVVNAAHGGSSINTWQPNATNYKEAVLMFKACQETLQKEIEAGHFTLSHMGYFWCQGCSDSTQSAEWYVNKYLTMHNGLKKDLAFDHDLDSSSNEYEFEFGGIIPILHGLNSYRQGEYKDNTNLSHYISYKTLTFTGPRAAQYWLGNSKEYEDIWLVCNIGDSWMTLPDGTNGVKEYFNKHYPNGKVDYETQIPQKESFYTPTKSADVHDTIHYNQIGYNEIGRESVRNALIMLGEIDTPNIETSVDFYSWDGYTKVSEIEASELANSSTLIVPIVSPLWKAKEVEYILSDGLQYNYYDIICDSYLRTGKLCTNIDSSSEVTIKSCTLKDYEFRLEDEVFTSVGDTENHVTKIAGNLENGYFIDSRYKFNKPLLLVHNENWILEFKMSGTWSDSNSTTSKKILCEDGASATIGAYCLLVKGQNGYFSIGSYTGSTHESYGVNLNDYNIDISLPHIYRLVNIINEDDSNTIYLYIDGVLIAPMDTYFTGKNGDTNTNSNGLSGKDFAFSYMGTPNYLLDNGIINYMSLISSNASNDIHFHDWTNWKEVLLPSMEGPGENVRECLTCGLKEYEVVNSIWQTTEILDHFTPLPDEFCANTNLWEVLPHDPMYYVVSSNKWGYHSSKNVPSITISVEPGDKIFATSFNKAGENGHATANGIRLTFFGINGIVKTTDPAGTYKEFSENGGYILTPEGAIAVNIALWNNNDDNEVYILNKDHKYKEEVVDPSCTESGYTKSTCTICHEEIITKYDKLNHNYEDGKCTRCNISMYRLTNIDLIKHQGGINSEDGSIITSFTNNWYSILEIPEGASQVNFLEFKTNACYGIAFYDNEKFILGSCNNLEGGNRKTIEIPSNAKYLYYGYVYDEIAQDNGYQIFDYIEFLGDSITIPEEDEYLDLPESQVLSFSVSVDLSAISNLEYSYGTDYGYIMLPKNYTKDGEPTRLVIVCHGAGASIDTYKSNATKSTNYTYLTNLGFAVMDMYACPTVVSKDNSGLHYGNPITLECYKAGYEYVMKHFNLAKDGIFVLGASMGGLSSFQIVQSGYFPVLAQVGYCPAVDIFKQAYCNPWNSATYQRGRIANYFNFDGTTTFTSSKFPSNDEIEYYKQNFNNTVNYSPITNCIVSGEPLDIFKFIPKSAVGLYDEEEQIYDNFIATHNAPLLVFHNLDDGTVSYRYSKYIVDMINRGSGNAMLYTFKTGGHNAWCNGTDYNLTDINGKTITIKETQYLTYLYLLHHLPDSSHKLSDTIVDPTCIKEGYTLHECESCEYSFIDSYKEVIDHSYENGYCKTCNILHPNLENFDGKIISIMSDSTSTFKGYIPVADGFNLEHRARYPQDNLFTDVSHTWWMQLITNLNAKLGVNESWAGSTISNISETNTGDIGPDASMSSITRIKNLGSNGRPDLILFYGGRNDISKNYTIGTFDQLNAPSEVNLDNYKWDTIIDAFVDAVLRIKYFYPNSELVIMLAHHNANTTANNKTDLLNTEIIKVCNYYGIKYLDLRELTEYKDHLPDASHPDEVGMDMITNIVLRELSKQVNLDSGENVTYSVKHNLINGKASLHYYKSVSKGEAFIETVTGKEVSVLMNDIDITSDVYENGVISIPCVNGEIKITVIDDFTADGHLQILPENICSNTNIWQILTPENIYYTVNGWGIFSNSPDVHSVTFNVNPGDKIWATSFGKAGENADNANGTRITWFNENGVLKTIDRNTVYSEFSKNGYILVPEGATSLNVPMSSNDPSLEIYILNKDHVYENGLCKCCNMVNPDLNSLNGKTVSILGDSISTYIGVSDDSSINSTLKGGNIYYTEGRWGVYRKDTWWQQVIDALGMKLLVNNSWSGSCVLHSRNNAPGAYINRCCQLHNEFTNEEPDIILIFISANDFSYFQDKLGDSNIDYSNLIIKNNDGSYSYNTPTTSCEAYAIMLHKITNRYQNAKVYCLTSLARRYPDYNDNYADVGQPTEFNKNLINIANNFNCEVIDLEKCGINKEADIFDKYIADKRTHPNPLGMDEISKAVCSALINSDVNICKVDYKVSNVTLDSSVNSAIINNSYHNKIILPESNTLSNVLVTMNGIDITSSAYNNNEINISKVTGDIFIEIIANRPFLNFAWTLEDNNLISTGETLNTATQIAGSIDDGVINNGQFSLENNIVLKHEVNWVIEFTFAYDWRGVIFSDNSNPHTQGMLYLSRTNGGNLCFGTYDGSSYQNYGVTLSILDNDPHKFSLVNEISNEGNMIYLYIDGEKIGAMDNYFVGSTSQNITSNWVNGKDFIFSFIGMENHALRDCKFESLYVYENGK